MKYIIAIGFFLLLPLIALPQNTAYQVSITSFTEKDGLSNNDVFCANKDTRGVLWVGTRYGLNRFDGQHFRIFTTSDGLKNNFINSIFPLGERYLLLGLESPTKSFVFVQKFQVFDAFTNRVEDWERAFPELPFRSKEVEYFVSFGEGLLFTLKSQEQFFVDTKMNTRRLPNVKKVGNVIALTEKNTFWTTKLRGGVLHAQKYSRAGKKMYGFRIGKNGESDLIWLKTDAAGNSFFSYISDNFSPTHILKIAPDGTKKVVHQFIPNTGKNYFSVTTLQYATVRGQYWAVNEKRAVLFAENWEELAQATNPENRFINQSRQNYFDADGLWQCSSNGLFRFSFKKNYFQTLFGEEELLSFRAIRRLGESLLFNSERGLREIDGEGRQKASPETRGLAATVTQNGEFWTGNFLNLYRIDRNGTRREYKMPFHEIWGIWADRRGNVWFSETGVKIFNPKNSSLRTIDYNGFEELAAATVYYFYEFSDKKIWLCSTSGLYEIDVPQEKVTARYWSGGKGKYRLPTDDLRHLYHDKKTGDIWIATGQVGLLRWQPAEGATEIFSFPKNATNITHAVYPDRYGFLWLSTDNGIVQWQKETQKFRLYTETDGLKTSEFNRTSHFQDTDGTIYFGSVDGVVRLCPRDFQAHFERAARSAPVIVEVQQYNERTNKVEDETEFFIQNNELRIQPYNRFFRLVLACTNCSSNDATGHFYQLQDDSEWQQADGNQLTFWRLPYGQQVIRIKTRLADGDFSKIRTVRVRVLAPIYLRWWFLVLAALAAGVGLYAWTQALRNRNLRLEEEVVRRTEKIAQQSEELKQLDELKSRFFANISHELRTPLLTVVGPIAKIKQLSAAQPELHHLARMVEKSSKKLLRLVNEILDLTKLEADGLQLKESVLDLNRFVKQQFALFEAHARYHHIDFVLNNALPPDCIALIDKEKLETIVSNLLSNALKFTTAQGKVIFEIKIQQQRLHFWVKDTGRGIHPDDLPHIFNRFYQSKHEKTAIGGTGIGLALSKEFSKIMAGQLKIQSEWGEGTTCTLEVPFKIAQLAAPILAEEAETQETTDKDNATEPKDKLPQILIVEDDTEVQSYLMLLLEPFYNLHFANNGQVALDYLQNTATLPDLILSDLMMPVMDGYEFLHNVKKDTRLQRIPFIMLTARAGIKDRLAALRIGIDDYITKPFVEEELKLRISNLLLFANWRKASQPLDKNLEDEWLTQVENLVKSSLGTHDFSVTTLAEKLNITRQTLNRQIKASTGLTTVQYIKEVRLVHARRLLEAVPPPLIQVVAEQVGINDVKYFTQLFKERFGVPPSAIC